MCVMALSATYGTHMISPQLWVFSRSIGMLGILCRGFNSIIVRRVGLLATSLRLFVALIPTSLVPSLTLFIIGVGLVREILMCVDLS